MVHRSYWEMPAVTPSKYPIVHVATPAVGRGNPQQTQGLKWTPCRQILQPFSRPAGAGSDVEFASTHEGCHSYPPPYPTPSPVSGGPCCRTPVRETQTDRVVPPYSSPATKAGARSLCRIYRTKRPEQPHREYHSFCKPQIPESLRPPEDPVIGFPFTGRS